MVEGSTCGRAGRRLRRTIVLVFLVEELSSVGFEEGRRAVALLVVVREVSGFCWRDDDVGDWAAQGISAGIELSTSVMVGKGLVVKHRLVKYV